MRTSAFWDTSALVPLCLRQAITPNVLTQYSNYEAVTWWATPVEMESAIARLARMGQLGADDRINARKTAKQLADSWLIIQPTALLRARATELVRRYDLKAGDSLQLAAALEWCEEASRGRMFLSADQKLRDAAVHCGFDALHL